MRLLFILTLLIPSLVWAAPETSSTAITSDKTSSVSPTATPTPSNSNASDKKRDVSVTGQNQDKITEDPLLIAPAKNAKSELAEKNQEEAKKFLEENGKKSGVVTLPSGLQYKILKEGQGKTPGPTDFVTVLYKGTLLDGTVFDSTVSQQKPVTFAVNSVIPGWTEALQLMKQGSKWMIFVPPNLAYGEKGVGHVIGPNQLLIFEIDLVDTDTGLNEDLKEKKKEWEDTD